MDRHFLKVVLLSLFARKLVFVSICSSVEKIEIEYDGW